jgi:hypothetical protein
MSHISQIFTDNTRTGAAPLRSQRKHPKSGMEPLGSGSLTKQTLKIEEYMITYMVLPHMVCTRKQT